jgi:formylglycine-generating enzyme required for sulfatase activity
MKNLFLLLCCFLFYTFNLFSQLNANRIEKDLVKINDTLYASKFEVSNGLYKEFLASAWLNSKTPDTILLAQIVASKWIDFSSNMSPFAKEYHSHIAFNNYPVVNIHYQGAILFCQWLSYLYGISTSKKHQTFVFNLPTEEEWEFAAKGKTKSSFFPWKGKLPYKTLEKPLCNYNDSKGHVGESSYKYSDNANVTAIVTAYPPSKNGLYNVIGNVSEMILGAEITKGGSWLDTPQDLYISSKQPYNKVPSVKVGFRYFATIKN